MQAVTIRYRRLILPVLNLDSDRKEGTRKAGKEAGTKEGRRKEGRRKEQLKEYRASE